MKDLVLIAGPTASGKTALALALARRRPVTVINADSMQVYRDLPILSAQPDEAAMREVPHRLFGFMDAATPCSAALWAAHARQAIDAARAEGRLPVAVGGTGLYFRALLDGLADIPDIPEPVRAQVREALKTRGAPALFDMLMREDPQMAARLNPADGQRIARALEVVRATGRSLADFQARESKAISPPGRRVLRAVLSLPREVLVERLETRFRAMLAAGGLEEAARLQKRGLNPALPAMKALGVPSLLAHLGGRMTREQAINDAVIKSRRYAKRQETWFNNQFRDWLRLDATEPESALETLDRAIAEGD
ncbi:MAG: tRNA (adenosine(37)-N6)-dimethylallyltransferase MiaA [Rhodothalassiaceae bacterium]